MNMAQEFDAKSAIPVIVRPASIATTLCDREGSHVNFFYHIRSISDAVRIDDAFLDQAYLVEMNDGSRCLETLRGFTWGDPASNHFFYVTSVAKDA